MVSGEENETMVDTQAAAPPPQVMFKMITGFWVSQTVGTLARLGVCDRLIDGPRSAELLAEDVEADPRALFRVLRAAASIGVVTRHDDDTFALTPVGQTLCSNVPGSMRDMAIAQTATGHWAPWGSFTEAVRTGRAQSEKALGKSIFEHYAENGEERSAFMGAMQNLSALVASELVRLVDWSGVQTVADIGGSDGTLVSAVLEACAETRGVLLDLPGVADKARGAVEARGLAERCEVVGGDFFESVPAADAYVLKQILHDWDDDQNVRILRNIAKALPKGGRVLVVEMIIPDDDSPSPAQLMDLNMLAMLPGRERTEAEYAALFEAAGLQLRSVTHTHSPFQIIEARAA
jgi:hypothetical protein